jgi:hypothetical protein
MEIIYEHHADTAVDDLPIWGPEQDAQARTLITDLFLSFDGDGEYIYTISIAAVRATQDGCETRAGGVELYTSKGRAHDEIMTRLLIAILAPHTYRPAHPEKSNIMFSKTSLGNVFESTRTSHDKIARIKRFVDLQARSDYAIRLMLLALKKAAADRAFKRMNF